MDGVTPMFPLGSPLLPGVGLPLHIFEPRYRQLVADLLESDASPMQFGVVMIERGREVGGGDERSMVGTMAVVVDLKVTDDGRYGMVIGGSHRIRVAEWLPDDPYPRAITEPWPDDPDPPGARVVDSGSVGDLRGRLSRLYETARELGDRVPDELPAGSDDPATAVYELAAWSPVTPADRFAILAAPSLAERCSTLSSALDDAEAVLAFRRS